MTYAGNNTAQLSQDTLNWQYPAPDPTQLTGLVELTEMQLESGEVGQSLREHYEAMKGKLVQQRHVLLALETRGVMVENNLRVLTRVRVGVEEFLDASTEDDIDWCWAVLDELDSAIEELRESTEELGRLLASAR
jgi:hypothetical protein